MKFQHFLNGEKKRYDVMRTGVKTYTDTAGAMLTSAYLVWGFEIKQCEICQGESAVHARMPVGGRNPCLTNAWHREGRTGRSLPKGRCRLYRCFTIADGISHSSLAAWQLGSLAAPTVHKVRCVHLERPSPNVRRLRCIHMPVAASICLNILACRFESSAVLVGAVCCCRARG